MKKAKLTILAMVVLLCVAFGACSKNKPTAVVTDGETTILTNVTGKPADYSAKEVAYAVAGYLEKAQTYTVETTGSTRAKKGMIDYTQNIANTAIKNVDEAFSQAVSTSTFANVTHQSFVKDGVDKVVYRGAKSGEPKVQTTSDYKSAYGVIPGIDNLGGWVLNDESILYAERKDADSAKDRNVYHYVLSKTLATGKMSVQMKSFGSLKDNPSFDSVELTLVVKDDFTPVSIQSVAKYDISIAVLGDMSCTQNLTAAFSGFNTEKTIPDSAVFNAAIGKDPTTEVPIPPISDPALEGLVGALVEYDIANGVALRGNTALNLGGTALNLPLEAGMKFDITSFDPADFAKSLNLSISTDVAGTPLALHSLGDGKVYIQLGSTKSVFDLAELGLGRSAGAVDFGSFVKVTETATGYTVAPSQLAIGMINPILNGMGVNLDRAEILFAVTNGRASSVALHLALSDTAGTALFALDSEMMIGDRAYVAPVKTAFTERSLAQLIGNVLPLVNVAEHFATADWAQGQRIELNIGVNILYDMEIPVTIDLQVNPAAATIAEMVNAKIHVDLSSTPLATSVQYLDLYYLGDGNLHAVIGYPGNGGSAGDVLLASIELGASLEDMLSGILMGAITSGGNVDMIASLVELAFGFTATTEENTTTLSASPAIVSSFNMLYTALTTKLNAFVAQNEILSALLPEMPLVEFDAISFVFAQGTDGGFAGMDIVLHSETAELVNAQKENAFALSLSPCTALADQAFDNYRAHVEELVANTNPAIKGLIGSLLGYDITHGVALRGNTALNLGGTALNLPLEAGIKFDMTSFDPANFAKSLNLSISTDVAGTPLALHSLGDGKVYIQLGSTKSVFDLAELGLGRNAGAVDFGSFVDVVQTAYGYRVALSPALIEAINPMLNDMGVNLDRAEILFAVTNGETASIELHLALSDTAGTALFALDSEMMIGDRAYVAPVKTAFTERSLAQLIGNVLPLVNVAEHFAAADWAQGQRIELNIGVNILYDMEIPVTIDLQVNPAAATIAEMVNAKIHVDLSTQGFENICSLAAMFGSPIFPTTVNYVDLFYVGDGNLYVVLGYEGVNGALVANNAKMVSTIALGDSLNGMIGGILMGAITSGSNTDIVAMLANAAFGFISSVEGNTTTLSATPEIVASFNSLYATLLATLGELASSGSPMGAMLPSMLKAEFSEINLAFSTDANGAFAGLVIDLKSVETGTANDEKHFVYQFSLAPCAALADNTFETYQSDIAKILSDVEVAAPIVNDIAAMTPYTNSWGTVTFTDLKLYDSVGVKINELKDAYSALTVDQKIMVYNFGVLLDYEEIYLTRRATAQNFADLLFALDGSAEQWTALNAAFKQLEAEEKDYLGYIVDRYLALLADYERANGVADLNTRIAAQVSALDAAATLTDLDAVKTALDAIKKDTANLLPESQKLVLGYQEALGMFNSKLAALLNADYATQKTQVDAIDTLDKAKASKTALDALNTRFNALVADVQATVTNQPIVMNAFDAKVAALLNAQMPPVTAEIKAITAETASAEIEATEKKAQALLEAYSWINSAEAKKDVTAYAEFAKVYPSTFEAIQAKNFQAKLDALKAQHASATTTAEMRVYYDALSKLRTDFNKLPDPVEALIPNFQLALDDCDARMLAAFDALYASLTLDMQTMLANFDEEKATALKETADLVTGSFHVKFFSSSNRNKFKNLNDCKALNTGAFGDAVNTSKLPALRQALAEIVGKYQTAATYADIQTYLEALEDFEEKSMKGFSDSLKSNFTEWVSAWSECNARRVEVFIVDLNEVTQSMLASIEAFESGAALDATVLEGLVADGAEMVARYEATSNILGSTQTANPLTVYRTFKAVQERFQAVIMTLAVNA